MDKVRGRTTGPFTFAASHPCSSRRSQLYVVSGISEQKKSTVICILPDIGYSSLEVICLVLYPNNYCSFTFLVRNIFFKVSKIVCLTPPQKKDLKTFITCKLFHLTQGNECDFQMPPQVKRNSESPHPRSFPRLCGVKREGAWQTTRYLIQPPTRALKLFTVYANRIQTPYYTGIRFSTSKQKAERQHSQHMLRTTHVHIHSCCATLIVIRGIL